MTQPEYRNINLSEFGPIIKSYWDEFETIEQENNTLFTGFNTPEHDMRTIKLIHALRKIDTWKSNIFLLYLHYKKASDLSKILGVKKSSLTVYISNIKKEIKSLL